MTLRGGETFLGRGCGDIAAVALAAEIGASVAGLCADEPGILTADPRVVAEAQLIEHLGFDQMLAMSAAGCPKPATEAIAYASRRGVSLHIRSAFTREPGTWTGPDCAPAGPAIVAGRRDRERAELSVVGAIDELHALT
ncbi:MAG: amino acid kinase family protein, partial [Solirubrobacteraceae bacterium]